jgi:hypothetical protein
MAGSDGYSRPLNRARVYLSGPMYFGGTQHGGTDEGRTRSVSQIANQGLHGFDPLTHEAIIPQ